MQYKMQFTVLDDAVKQNRKLPEIAFFDTDGNLIHLGGDDGGGDVSALLPLDGSRHMTGELTNLIAVGASFDAEYETSYAEMFNDGRVDVVRASNDRFLRAGLMTDADWAFSIDARGRFEWGDGLTVPDMSLERAEFNDDPYLRVHGHGDSYQWSQIASESWDVNFPGIVYQAALYADEAGYAGVYLQPGDPEFEILTSKINNAGVFEDAQRFAVHADGSLHWGDGTVVPDVTLERDATGAYNALGTGDLRLSGIGEDHALILGSLDGDYTQAGGYVGGSGAYWQSDENHRVNIHAYGAIDLVTQDGFLELEGAGLSWGPVGGGTDTTLKRSAPGILRNTANGGGFKLTSPDGSQTKTVRLSNAGALELV